MPNLTKTLEIVVSFLDTQGAMLQKVREDTKDGHWYLRWCLQHKDKELCPCGLDECFRQLFTALEDGSYIYGKPLVEKNSTWTRACTNKALAAGGYELWPEEI